MTSPATHLIELKLRDMSQLFNSMDPSPFNERDLDKDAEEFIVSWAHECPRSAPLCLRVYLERWPEEDPAPTIREGVHHYFAYRARMDRLEFRHLLKEGRTTLAVGVVFLATCLALTALVQVWSDRAWSAVAREGLTIAGWVAMWRPLQVYLYDWWPIRRRAQLSEKLSEMPVEVLHSVAPDLAVHT